MMYVVGHRGAAGEAPENTIAGCRHAIDRGVRHIEIDLQLSADDQLVVIHDLSVNRTTGARGAIGKFSAAQLRAMDARCGTPPWPRKFQAGVPTLSALLRATPELKSMQLEVKAGSRATTRRIAELLAQRYPDRQAARGITVTCSKPYLHECLIEMAPHLDRGLVCQRARSLKKVAPLGCTLCVMHFSLANAETVSSLQAQGIAISAWTVNDPATVTALHQLGVESVITDYPSMALPLVARLNATANPKSK